MAKINLLTKDIYNRIAAGEVVENPAAAVKELVENSLDAGASEISVYVEKYGTQLIRVCDNGSGIEKDDIRAAFMSHATSKISCTDDLDNITTLGFRGEALASIAAISIADIVSSTDGIEGYKVICENGYIGKAEPAACSKGTEVSIHNLFYNTPARAKFLKSEKQELASINTCMTKFILGNPDVSFRYYVDGGLTLQSYGNGLDEAFAQIYNYKTISQCFKINGENQSIKVHGFISNQNFSKPNRNYQHLFINGRSVVNETVSIAVKVAYQSYLMTRQFPLYVLFVDMPSDMLDVNVHPNKMEVRFSDNHAVYHAVYSILSGVLDGNAQAADFVIDKSALPDIKSTMPQQPAEEEKIKKMLDAIPQKNDASREKSFYEKCMEEKTLMERSGITKEQLKICEELSKEEPVIKDAQTELSYNGYYWFEGGKKHINKLELGSDNSDYSDFLSDEKYEREKKAEQEKFICKEYTYKGNMFNTYLIYEIESDVYIIDQHAAHERLIYDSLKKQLAERNVKIQGMLVPYVFGLTAEENVFFEENLPLLRDMGFDIVPFGTYAWRICEVPADLINLNFKEFIADLLSELDGLRKIKLEDILKDKIALTACKHAVKGGRALTKLEADELIKNMNGDMGLKCPHGRPVAVKLTKQQIEKMFKRIV